MNDPVINRRVAEAAALRGFFQDQWEHLRQLEEEKKMGLLNPERNMDNPAVYIDMLVEQLSVPGKLIRLQDKMLRIDRMVIKLPLDSKASSDLLRLYEVEIGEHHLRVAAIVRYPHGEFLASVNQASG